MNKYVKQFFLRGLMFSGFGPIIFGIIIFIISKTTNDFSILPGQILLGIVSIYLLAFLQAGASVFNQIEHWPITKQLLCHFSTIYIAYLLCYVLNSWIPFKLGIVAMFTAIFVVGYFIIWLTVYLSVKAVTKKMNKAIK
ncbi:MAG: DUF3021 domain-containing protein [Clostridia bacterium]|nr:DUF3021 domain-containing protein [Clostridia bacterium]